MGHDMTTDKYSAQNNYEAKYKKQIIIFKIMGWEKVYESLY